LKNLQEEQQAEVCMGTSVALKKPRDDENRADKGSGGEPDAPDGRPGKNIV
jgi:hypothetical protein